MPKNKVQFQKGLSLTQFLQDYGSEAQCEQALFDARWPDGLNCPRCGGARFCRLSTRRATFQCNHCKRQLSLLAGTVFQATKLPLSIWFLAIYFLSQTKSGISALELGRKLGVNDNTAWLLKHKLMQAMRERDQRYRLAGTVQLDDAYLGGEYPGGKRGRGSPNKTPMLAAVQVSADGQPVVMKLSVVAGFRTAEVAQWAAQHLQPRDHGAHGRAGLLPGAGGSGLRAQATRDGRRQAELRDPRAGLGEHDPREREALLGRHLPCLRAALRGALPGRVPVPLQSPLRAGGAAAQAAEGGGHDAAVAASDPAVERRLTAAAAASPIHRAFDNPAARGTGRRHSPGTIRGLPGGPGCDRYHWLPVHLVPSASPPCLPTSRQPPKIHKPTPSGALLG